MKVGDLVRLKDGSPHPAMVLDLIRLKERSPMGIVIDIIKQVKKRHSPLAGDIVVYWPDVEMKTVEFWDCLRLVDESR